jgi:2-iminobutanoate/2-iminopropanoate deaminase
MWKTVFFLVIIVFAVFLFSRDHKKEIIFTKLAPLPIGPYSQATRSGKMLFVSGQIGLQVNGTFDTTSIENECRQVMTNIKAIVEEAGMEMDDITKATIYLTDLKNFPKINDVYKTYFLSDPPARETVEVRALPKGAHVEISVIAE